MEKAEKQRIKEIKKQALRDRKIKRALHIKRFRGFKNFLWWFTGVVSSFAILAGTVFVAVGVLPIGTYFGGKEQDAVSEDVSSKSLLTLINSLGELQVSDFKILQDTVDELFASSGADEFIVFDKQKFSELKFVYGQDEEKTFGSEIQNCIKISKALFGDDLASLGIFEHTEVPVEEIPTPDQNFAPSIYYYVSSGSVANNDAVYSRAFNDDKTRVEDSIGKTLYYVALDYLPFGEMKDLIGERLGQIKISTLLTTLGNDLTGSPIAEILGDVKINGIGSFDIGGIKLSVFLPTSSTQIYDLLCSAVTRTDGTTVTPENLAIGDITGATGTFDMNAIKLNAFLPTSSTQIYDLLCSAITRTDGTTVTADNLTIGDITGATGTFDINAIKLNTFISETGNESIYDLLCGAITRTDSTTVTADNLTIGDLTGATGVFNMDVKLSAIIPYEDQNGQPLNSDIYDILCDAIVRKDASQVTKENLTLGDLTGKTGTFTIDGVALSSMLNPATNTQFYNIMRDLTADKYNPTTVTDYTVDKHNALIRLNDLNGKDFSVIRLSQVLPETGNESLYGILKDVTGMSANEIKVSDLNGLSTNQIKLSTVIPYKDSSNNPINTDLYNVLCDAIVRKDTSQVTKENLTLGDLTGERSTFNMGGVKLTTVIPSEDQNGQPINTELYNVLYDVTGLSSDQVTVDSLTNFDIDKVKLSTVLPLTSTNASLYKVIRDLTRDVYNPQTMTDYSEHNHNYAVLLSDLKVIDVNKLSLSAVLDDTANSKLYDIIREAVGADSNSEITVGSLNNFEIGRVRLVTVIDKNSPDIQSNNILKHLVEDEDATVDHLGEKINNLDMSILYDQDCFTTDKSKANVNVVSGIEFPPVIYKKIKWVNGTETHEGYLLNTVYAQSPSEYTLADDKDYYIAKSSHVWLFLLYNYDYNGDNKNADDTVNADGLLNDHDEYGNAKFYHVYHHKLSALQGDVAHISEEIMNAKIRQLADAGILEDGEKGYKDSVYKKTMNEVLKEINDIMPN